MKTKNILLYTGVGAGILLLASSLKSEDGATITIGGGGLTSLRDSAGGIFKTTTTTTEELIGSDDGFEDLIVEQPTEIKSSSTSSARRVSGTSVKGGVEFRDSSGTLVGVQDDVKQQSRLPTLQEKLTGKSQINTNPFSSGTTQKSTSLRSEPTAPKSGGFFSRIGGWFK